MRASATTKKTPAVADDRAQLPDPHQDVLPSRAYLLAWRLQTIPARRAGLQDAERHYDEAAAGDAGYRDMALLGLIGDALQALEDVAYSGTAYENAIPGVPFYVTGTVFSGTRPTTFYGDLRNWDDDRFKVLAALRVRPPNTQRTVPLLEALGIAHRYAPEDHVAVKEAEEATVRLLRPYMLTLAATWKQFATYFHAFKHGGTLISRRDFTLYAEDGEERTQSIGVWWSSKNSPQEEGHGDTKLRPSEVAYEVSRSGHLALDIADYLVDARLRSLDSITFGLEGEVSPPDRIHAPWEFWLHAGQLSDQARARLEVTFGVEFHRRTEISGRRGC